MTYLKVKNWDKFQHYKDRRPPWIKLYSEILNDRSFSLLSMSLRGVLMQLWVLASENNGFVLFCTDEISFRLRATIKDGDLKKIINSGLLSVVDSMEDFENPWKTRYITREIKDAVLKRDGHKCVDCDSKENIEFDHIMPVSRGGDSTIENIQLLCRSCNRKKRSTMVYVADATQTDPLRNLETETETEKIREEKRQIKIPDWLNEELWKEFKKYRTQIKSPLTEHAEKLCIADLKKMIDLGHNQDDVINQTIMSGKWKSFYPVKDKTAKEGRVQPKEFELEIPDDMLTPEQISENIAKMKKITGGIG